MTEDIILRVKGTHISDGEPEIIENISPGSYYYRNGKHYFVYEEIDEEDHTPCKNRIKLEQGHMELFKKSSRVNVHMDFEAGKKNLATYQTPYGNLAMGVDTGLVELTETDTSITARIKYVLELNNEFAAECEIYIVAAPAGTEITIIEN